MSADAEHGAVDVEALAAASLGQLVEYLELLLTRQLERLRRYDLDGAIVLAEEADKVGAVLARNRVLDDPAFAEPRRRIQQLYRELDLVLASERAQVADKLQAIRKGIRTLSAYADNG